MGREESKRVNKNSPNRQRIKNEHRLHLITKDCKQLNPVENARRLLKEHNLCLWMSADPQRPDV